MSKYFIARDSKAGDGDTSDKGAKVEELSFETEDGETKTVTIDDVKGMLGKEASLTQKAQKLAAMMDATERYQLDPEDFVKQAELSFDTMAKLIQAGVITDTGELVKKGDSDTKPDPSKLKTTPKKVTFSQEESDARTAEIIAKALKPFQDKLDVIDRAQMGMIRESTEKEIMAKHQNLSKDDVDRVVALAMQDSSKTVWQHAEAMAKAKSDFVAALRAKHAEEFGVDITKFEANKVQEADAKGGGAAAIIKGKQIRFDGRRKTKDSVTPLKAAQDYLKHVAPEIS